jgi:hypothetical protein
MRIVRLVAWVTVAALLCWTIEPVYQRQLAALVNYVLHALGQRVRLQALILPVPYDIGLFIALCLASTGASWRQRIRAILIGAPVMTGLEVLTVVAGISIEWWCGMHTVGAEVGRRINVALLHSIQFTNALLVWLALLGHREPAIVAPLAGRGRRRAAGAPRMQ